jgi:serine/threonine kinase 32|tara:strand:- start:388 stop:549 length:162 start_codon:yes stop_codon:yes gene_type:complete
MEYAFQDSEKLFLVSDLMSGGDLRYHIGKRIKFDQAQTKFMVACLVVSLEYIH